MSSVVTIIVSHAGTKETMQTLMQGNHFFHARVYYKKFFQNFLARNIIYLWVKRLVFELRADWIIVSKHVYTYIYIYVYICFMSVMKICLK